MVWPSGANRAETSSPRRNVNWWKEGGGTRPARCPARKERIPATSAVARRAPPKIGHGMRLLRGMAAPGHNGGGARAGGPGERLQVEKPDRVPSRSAPPGSFQTVPDDPIQSRREVPVGLRKLRRLFRQDRRNRVGCRVAVKGALARKHLVEDRPESEDVRPLIRRLPTHLLGRHVAHRPQHEPRLCAERARRKVRLPSRRASCASARRPKSRIWPARPS